MEPGLYVTFFNRGEPADRELPPVGPLEHVVVRSGSLIADRKPGGQADEFGGMRWIEAELELRRATGQEPGGVQHSELRIAAPEGVYLRFVAFESGEHDALPELGPYAVVVIGRRGVEADGDQLATRAATSPSAWELTGMGGSAFVGIVRPDIAFRTRSTAYHPSVNGFRAASQALAAPQPAAAASVPTFATPRPPDEPGPTLLDRIGSEPSRRVDTPVADERREWASAAWELRYVIIGALVALIIAFSIPSITSLFAAAGPDGKVVSVGSSVSSPTWTYTIGRVRRAQTIGVAQANGTYLIVQITATNRTSSTTQLSPNGFLLHASTGEEYTALPPTGAVYSSAQNPDSPLLWPTEFPAGKPVLVSIVFEIKPAIEGALLTISDVPSTRIRLE